MKRAFFLSLLVLLAACTLKGSQGYIDALSSMVRSSDRIVVIEHSFELDAYDFQARKSLVPGVVVYRTVELSQKQRDMFFATVESLDPKTQDAFGACIFEPHHTVRFYSDQKLLSTMRICFKCKQVEWDGTTGVPPWSLYRALHSTIKGIGLEPEGDWKALAQQHLHEGSNNASKADVAKATRP